MHARDFMLVLALCGCTSNPDPRRPSIEHMERTGTGAWIVLENGNLEVAGELIAIQPTGIVVLQTTTEGRKIVFAAFPTIGEATLYEYVSEGGVGGWGALGVLSTISHGILLILTAPAWVLTSSIVSAFESRHMILSYPGDSWQAFAQWARFPQGLPPDVDENAMLTPRARRAPAPAPVPVAPGRAEAWELTKQAQTAALAADGCTTVVDLAGRVQQLDAELYATVFVRDLAVRRCLGLQ